MLAYSSPDTHPSTSCQEYRRSHWCRYRHSQGWCNCFSPYSLFNERCRQVWDSDRYWLRYLRLSFPLQSGVSILRYIGISIPIKYSNFSGFYKKLGPFYKKLRCDKFGNRSISTVNACNNQIKSSIKIDLLSKTGNCRLVCMYILQWCQTKLIQ